MNHAKISNMNKLSVVINTLNEAENIASAIKSVKKIADEIVVVDMESDDDTRKIAKDLGAKIFLHRRMGYVEPARNFAISKARNEWILIIDADERITKTLRKKILNAIQNDSNDYYTLPRKNIIFGKWIEHTGWWPDYNIRLFKKSKVSWEDEIHSVPVTQGQGADFEPIEENAIVHYNYKDVESFINRLNRYSTIQARERVAIHKKFSWQNLISKPTSEFVNRYFNLEGYKDGVHGLALSFLQAFSELVTEIKVWQESKFLEEKTNIHEVSKELRASQKEMNYWISDTLVKESGNFTEKMRRKFKI